MSEKVYHYICSVFFGSLTIIHLARALQGWEAQVAGTTIPIWTSWVSAVIAAYLTLRGLSIGHKEHNKESQQSSPQRQ